MVCSNCQIPHHTYRTCPSMTTQEKEAKRKLIEAKKKASEERNRIRNERIQREISSKKLSTYYVNNTSNSSMVLYSCESVKDTVITRFAYVNAYSTLSFTCVKEKHIIVFFPLQEVQENNSNEAIKHIAVNYIRERSSTSPRLEDSENVAVWTNKLISPYKHNIDICMRDFDGTEITLVGNYTIKKTKLEQWMECALKSKFLLDQIHQMTGGGKTLKAYENIEPFMDMVEDIEVPECSEFEKENSGVPSMLTNV